MDTNNHGSKPDEPTKTIIDFFGSGNSLQMVEGDVAEYLSSELYTCSFCFHVSGRSVGSDTAKAQSAADLPA